MGLRKNNEGYIGEFRGKKRKGYGPISKYKRNSLKNSSGRTS